jgi:hypothetical protein
MDHVIANAIAIALKVSRSSSTFASRAAGVEHDPHEKVAGLDIVELLGVENVEAPVEQRGRDFCDDPRPVEARQGENVAAARQLSPPCRGRQYARWLPVRLL